MYQIRYYYSSLSRQLFVLVFALYLLARLILFHVGGFSRIYQPFLSTLLYVILIGACVLLFVGHRCCCITFDEEKVIKRNKLRKKEDIVYLNDISKGKFSVIGIRLYTGGKSQYVLYIPIWFFGKISPVGMENFEVMLRNVGVPEVERTYSVLPGYGRGTTFLGYLFFFSAIPFFLAIIQYGYLIFMIVKVGGIS